MTLLIPINIIVFIGVFVYVLRRTKRDDPRVWLRFPVLFICGWYVLVYGLAFLNIITEDEIKYFMRWFHLVVAAYMLLEAKYG